MWVFLGLLFGINIYSIRAVLLNTVVLDCFFNAEADFHRVHSCPAVWALHCIRWHHLWQAGWHQSCKPAYLRFCLLALTSFIIPLLIGRKMILDKRNGTGAMVCLILQASLKFPIEWVTLISVFHFRHCSPCYSFLPCDKIYDLPCLLNLQLAGLGWLVL